MPELPEVHTTSTELNKVLPGLVIHDVWTDYQSHLYEGKKQIKSKKYFKQFKKDVVGAKIKNVSRRGKNVLIHLAAGNTVVVHMKMTGHLLVGRYTKRAGSSQAKIPEAWRGQKWIPVSERSPLRDPINRFIHLVFSLSSGKSLALSDVRKFAKISVTPTKELEKTEGLIRLGPDALGKFSFKQFKERLCQKPNGKIKQVLMDQEIIAGIGNIYSDEMLWRSSIHPLSKVSKIPNKELQNLYQAMKQVLKKGIDFGGDSDSDYRQPSGLAGRFQEKHRAYRKTGQPCEKNGCSGIIKRIKVGGRSAHFCAIHQKLF